MYLAGVRHLHIALGHANPVTYPMERLRLLIKRARRESAKERPERKNLQRPVTADAMRVLRQSWEREEPRPPAMGSMLRRVVWFPARGRIHGAERCPLRPGTAPEPCGRSGGQLSLGHSQGGKPDCYTRCQWPRHSAPKGKSLLLPREVVSFLTVPTDFSFFLSFFLSHPIRSLSI